MLTFGELAIGDRFQYAGYRYTKRSDATASDAAGGIARIGSATWVEKLAAMPTFAGLAHIATKPDILRESEPSHETRITRLTITPPRAPLYCEEGFNIELVDEADGEFVRVTGTNEGLTIAPSEWPMLRRAIDRMIQRCREDSNEED